MFLIDEIVDQFEQSFDEQSNQRTVKTVKKLFVVFLELSQKYRLDEINVSLLTGPRVLVANHFIYTLKI